MIKYKALLLLACTLLIAGCDEKKEPPPPQPRVVKAFTITSGSASNVRIFPARIQAGDNTELAFKRAGRIEQLDLRDGMVVKANQTLARLNDTDARLRVKDRQNSFQLADRQYQRFRTLSNRSAVSQADMDVQKSNRDAAATALKVAQEELQFLTLSAPFDGVIARVNVRNHQVVAAGQPIALLTRADVLDVIFTVPESLFTALDIQNASYQPEVQFNALPDRTFTASYKEHSTQTDAATLTWQVVLTMPRPADLPNVAGLSGTVRIQLHNLPNAPQQSQVVVPAAAVFNPDRSPTNQPHVWLIVGEGDNLHVKDQQVEVGNISAEGIEIISGLKTGDRVVSAGTGELREGEAIRIWTRERGL
ncbi:efflux RND transporter periplasmic adaptor subunit [Pantoea phytobeneficialis]|uniref:Efflux RND transporter periplasmic adaptor subunit n=1 Tax=Pantoea phytobeneficialis TaxID=2052056 RepID=A0AAP9HA25_9GAMM|nr:efflux RND transporter periplasmic adaptor subunit [Pantoea phytobeneficialis]MDO6406777.1 efflux RND transporter periplasmic adaptor subunit [Pantoea phytobeneficialis]QGR09304.1 efflux transporter periplasmic adaptor subunit [Pantoea phytobeneficialis]